MKIRYDSHSDTLRLILQERPVAESDEERPGIIMDYDGQGNLLAIAILDASHKVTDATNMDFQAA
jgi:YD repeat-containing protein